MKNNESISHEILPSNEIKYVEDIYAMLHSLGVDQFFMNHLQHVLLEWISSNIKNIGGSTWKIHESNLEKFEDFANDCFKLNCLIKDSLNEYLMKLNIIHCLIDEIKSKSVKSSPAGPFEVNSHGHNRCKGVELNQNQSAVISNEEEYSIQTTFFRAACEIFPTRTPIGIN